MQMVQKMLAPLLAIAFCSLFLLGCSSEDTEAPVQEAPAETVIEQVEPEITLPLDQQPEKVGYPGEEVEVQTTPEEEMETVQEQEETVPDVTVEPTETDTEEERRPTRPRRALEGC
ncbi:hypothetical protein [Desulfobulbus alkaliphilus]|uniref:hypothetical protein n=1 Tax=Desulfobulbus alkaliphilus TaxID=869814 RepID=UPI0019639855|nr:hypothetical protein [Desulfobulbus alkaliphilus]MBM9536429.1 hypothetical protein [Desulfobulbus alkaliphilus]